VNFGSFVKTCAGIWSQARRKEQTPVTVCVLGPPGVGKTAAGRALAAWMTQDVQSRTPTAPPAVCFSLDLSSMLPEDLMGLPFRDANLTRYCPQAWMAPMTDPDAYGVLILDDLPAAAGNVQVACRQVSLERRIHEMKLAPGIFVIVTGNRREDKSAATTLPAHFRNSVCILPFSPDFEGWESWYHDQGFDPDIPAFLHFKRDHFSRLPKDADARGAFATPRTWSMLGKLTTAVSEDHLPEVASGLVGDGVASEFAAFRMLRRELVDPEKVLENPRKSIPDLGLIRNRPDRAIALITGLGEVAARKAKGPKSTVTLTKFLKAMAYVTSDNREFVSVGVSTFTACKGSMKDLLNAARKGGGDEDIRTLIRYLAKTLEK
jgi:hypothetical protein